MKKFYTSAYFIALFCLLFVSSRAIAQNCEIADLTGVVSDCENNQFFVTLEFEHASTGDSFFVAGNGTNYGTYNYGAVPIVIGPLPTDGTDYEFVVTDADSQNCTDFVELGAVMCDTLTNCELFDLVVEFDECTSDSTYRIDLNFDHANTNGVGFDLWANGDFFGFYSYNDLPLTINDFPLGPGNTNGLQVCDNDNLNCCVSEDWPTPNCASGGACDIRDLVAEVYDCANGVFYIDLDFIYENTSDTFLLTINQQPVAAFMYSSLPLTIGPLPATSFYNILISDLLDPNCNEMIFVDSTNCTNACNLSDLVVDFDECTSDSTYRVFVDFNYVNTTSQYFTAFANGVFFGVFEYADLPLTINHFPLEIAAFNSLTVCDTTNSNCCTSTEWPTPQCGSVIGNCDIENLEVSVANCNNGLFFAILDFDHVNTTSRFNVNINGINWGNYIYNSVPLTLGPLTSNSAYEYIVTDVDFGYCADTAYSSASACDSNLVCELFNLVVEIDSCTSDTTYIVVVDFDHVNSSGVGFDLWANGVFFGFYSYAELPLTINNFPLDIAVINSLQICDNDNSNCCISESWQTPDCGQGDCMINDLTATPFDCSNGLFFVNIDFIPFNTSDTFELTMNGNGQGIYTHLPITLGPLTSNAPYEFLVSDLNFPNCQNTVSLASSICDSLFPCEILNLEVEFDECTSDTTYRIFLDFDYDNTSGVGFDLWANGNFFGFYSYNDLPLTINHFPVGPGQTNGLQVCDNDNINCCASEDWPTPNCGQGGPCSISHLVVEAFDCDSFHFYLEVDFNFANVGDSFKLQGNGHFYGNFSYADLPIVLGPFSVNQLVNELVVIDLTHMNCAEDIEFDIDCGGGNECGIDHLEVEVGKINGTTFELTFSFEFENTSDSFDAFSGNIYVGTFAYADLPVTIADFPTRNLPHELLRVCDAEFHDCCDVIEFVVDEACDECKISEVSATVVECFGDSIIVVMIDFDVVEGSSDGFEVIGNGHNYGTFSYDDLPIEITLDYEAGDFVDLIIRDLSTPTCLGYTFIDEVDCEELCELSDLTVDFQECTSDTTYNFILNFNHQGTGSLGFDLFGNGHLLGFYSYDSLPLLIENFVSTGVQIDHFLVCDNDNANCCEDVNLPIPNCITGLQNPDEADEINVLMGPGQWQIKVKEAGELTVFDMAGRQVRPNYTIKDEVIISDLAPGTYLITWSGWWGVVSQKAVFMGQ